MRKNRKKAFAAILSLLFGAPVFTSCANGASSSVAPHECVFYKVDAVEATCLHEGNIAYEQCPYCQKILVDGVEKTLEDVTLPINLENHEQLRSVDEVPATCLTDGTKAHQYCDACGNYVLDGVNYTKETLGDNLVIPKGEDHHDFLHVAQVDPTCVPGMKEHDYCDICHKYFLNGQEVTKESLTIPANGEHVFDEHGLCKNGCGVFTKGGKVFEEANRYDFTPVKDPYVFDYTLQEDYGKALAAKRMSFATQGGSKSTISYSGQKMINTQSEADSNFTRFAPGTSEKQAYVGKFLVSFDVVVTEGTVVNRVGARITNNKGSTVSEETQDLLIGVSGSGSENNPDREFVPGQVYRFVYRMETTEDTQLVQLWHCLGNAGTLTIQNLHFIPLEEKDGAVKSELLYFGKTDMAKDESGVAVAEIKLNKSELNLVKGSSETLTATVLPENAKDKTVTWTTSDEKVATVDNTGKVTAVAAGTATITAKAGDVSATCTVNVTDSAVPVSSVTLDKETLELMAGGKSAQLTATIAPDNATDKSLVWESSDEKVATVDQTGLVTPVAEGTATITVKTKDGKQSDTCTVTVTKNVSKSYYLFNNTDFFDGNNWYDDTASTTKRGESIISEDNSLVFTDKTPSRIDLFHVGKNASETMTHLGDKAEKWTGETLTSLMGKPITYDMTINASGAYDMLILGNNKAYKPTSAGNYAFWVHFEEGKITLNADQYDAGNRGTFPAETDAFQFGKDNKVSLKLTRVDKNTLTIQLLINDQPIKFESKEVGKYYSVDENGILTSSEFLKSVGYGQRFGIYPATGSTVHLTSLSIDPAPVAATGITLNKTELELKEGGSETLKATVSPEGSVGKVTWTSSDEKVATVDQNGKVTAVAEGTTDITATINGKSAVCKVTVTKPAKSCIVYNGKDFFNPSDWETAVDVDSETGSLVFDADTTSRFDLFHCAGKAESYLHYGDANNKSGIDQVVGKSSIYTMSISTTGSFDLMLLGVSGAKGPSTSGAAAHYLHIGEDGKVSLDMTGPNSDHFKDRFTADSTFEFNKENTIAFTVSRISKDALTLTISINGQNLLLKGETFKGDRGTYSVDEKGVFTNTYPSSGSGMGQRFGVYPAADSVVTISGLSITNN